MCQALAQNGHDVQLVASSPIIRNTVSAHGYYGIRDIFKVILLKGKSDKIAGLLLFLTNFLFFIKKTSPPDVFYGRDIFTLYIASLISKGTPFYFEAHKPPTTVVHMFLTRKLAMHKNLLKLVVITHALKEEFLKIFPDLADQKILVAPDGADLPEPGSTKKEIKTANGKIVIGYVGHLYPGRGMDLVYKLSMRLPQYDFHIIGGNKKDVERWQKACISLENIHFQGFVPHKDLDCFYDAMDIVLAPYQSKVTIAGGGGDTVRWMSPLKIFEYMAFAKPIIASDLPALKEILCDGFNAVLCPPDSLDDWVNAVELLVRDKHLREQIAANAYACLKEKYTWRERASLILKYVGLS